MKTLIVEDDFTNRLILQEILSEYGEVQAVTNGRESVQAVKEALRSKCPYDLICLDIMMPEMNGQEALQHIRKEEEKEGIVIGRGAKVIMTTALRDKDNVMTAFRRQADAYLPKPFDRATLVKTIRDFELIDIE